MQRDPHWIDGKPAMPANGQWLDVFDPATREVASQVADAFQLKEKLDHLREQNAQAGAKKGEES